MCLSPCPAEALRTASVKCIHLKQSKLLGARCCTHISPDVQHPSAQVGGEVAGKARKREEKGGLYLAAPHIQSRRLKLGAPRAGSPES